MDVSIIIINYNSFELISDLLESFYSFSNSYTYQIIIVDNGSSDDSLVKLKSRFNDITFIENNANLGFGAANNIGLKKADGKYVLFLNNDTLFLENSIMKIINFLESKKNPTLVGCKLLNSDRSIQHSVLDFPTLLNTFASNFFLYALFPKSKYFNKYHLMNKGINSITEVEIITGAFIFGRRKDFIDLGGFDERFFFYAEEMDLCKRLRDSGGKIYYFPETSIVHLKGTSTKRNYWFQYRNQSISTIKIFQKHFNGIKFPLALIIHYLGILFRIPIFLLGGLLTFNKTLFMRGIYFMKLLFVYPKNNFNRKEQLFRI